MNTAIALHASGVLERYGVELIGADVDAIERGENREKFRSIVESIGGSSARSIICHTMEQCVEATSDLGYPVVVRPSFTMGGAGSGTRTTRLIWNKLAAAGLQASPTTEVLLEESICGLEGIRDSR